MQQRLVTATASISSMLLLYSSTQVVGGDPLLRLIAVDWFTVEQSVDKIALHPRCLVQSEAGKKLPFIFVINLLVPAKLNYSLFLYFAADRPMNKDSLLAKFVNGSDAFSTQDSNLFQA
ncbi:uncharacterized protein LOC130972575 [Arachis stenosperma]|uniref:uncharacterized protein LOC130972575 n=1 Tax=Arachis stenosperma TaxID=217475 RepID=UPI0025AC5928|nr:uncharacterized protein LOC130972575 [Arachis stenosperma]